MDLEQVDLPPRIYRALKRACFDTIDQVLHLSATELATRTSLEQRDVQDTLTILSEAVYSCVLCKSTALLERRQQYDRLSVGDPYIDAVLRGGVLTSSITEVHGKSAVGKTQLMLQLCIMAQLPVELGGLASGALYIATEQTFPINRFAQLEQHMKKRFPQLSNMNMSDNVHIVHIRDHETQQHILSYHLATAMLTHNIRLVIVDSIAANFRGDEDVASWDAAARAKAIFELGASLKKLAHEYNAAVVCVNQVTDIFNDTISHATVGGIQGGDPYLRVTACVQKDPNEDAVTPTLGLAWSNIVNTRIKMSRRDTLVPESDIVCANGSETAACNITRTLTVCFGPHLPLSNCKFEITASGIVGLSADK
ncbi:uncharacterized protein SPPG_01982 [Spizellomyces punctatus DAOM BR117]|uniref:RecA family profile 1 domain-containing protein n=1 Tax=Spizellomyces punctatus (strain DAOM BR117) TaxID=645134 RepID=A0A0L0HP80_SPIPD|nr:uncharacterized protein SPPG_01982 [Spizellomyces punctatus DAOM BR117]KND02902.1 hypothetical protein SPPG_01982 [Spizellomyces punctatus DAOM BR117]|eukprot:XP_016610941.1 hypothetical protein SPPG_01982 [Spizellomyces punctatus DAOM BR117]